MKKFQHLSNYVPFLLLLCIAGFFFYKTVIFSLIPFPGDLLVSEYQPWRAESYLGYVAGSIPQKAQYFDVLQQLYPWKTQVINSLKLFSIPLWNPYNFAGSPLLANGQSAVFYPLNLIYELFSQRIAWTILIILQPLLASYFMYVYCRKLTLSSSASIITGIAFGYSLYMSVFLEYNTLGHVILWLPLALWAIEKGTERLSRVPLGIFGFSILAAGFAGHLQLFVVMLTFILFYLLFRLKNVAYVFCYLAILLLSVGIGAIQHLPTWELLSLSARSNHPYQYLTDTLLIQPQQLFKFISPDIFGNPATRNYLPSDSYPSKALYIGLIPFILSVCSISLYKKNKLIRIFTITCIVLLLFTLKSPVSLLLYRTPIPFLSTSSPTNALFLLSFALSVMAGFGWDRIVTAKKQLLVPVALTAFCILLAWILSLFHIIPMQKNSLIYTTLIFAATILAFLLLWYAKTKRYVLFIVLFLTVFDLFYFFQKFNPFIPMSLVFPATPVTDWLKTNAGINRIWGYGTAALSPNIQTQYHIFSPDGYDPLYPKRYGEIINASDDGNISKGFTNQTRSDARISPGYGEIDLPSNMNRLKLLQLLGVRYILDRNENGSTQKTFPPSLFSQVASFDQWHIFEYRKASPRAYLTSSFEVYTTAGEFEKIFFNPSFDPRKTVLLEEKPDSALSVQSPDGDAKVSDYQANKVTIETTTNGTKLLFLSDTYFPGWVATVDHVPVKIFRAFWSFRAVVVPAGTHTVVFSYQPQSFHLGTKMTIISVVLIILAISGLPKLIKRYEK